MITVPTKLVADIAKMLGYRRKTVAIHTTTRVTLSDLNWSGGSRSVYSEIRLLDGKVSTPNLSFDPPWSNDFEGKTVEIPEGTVIVRTGTFCGRPSMMDVYVRPENMPPVLEGAS